MGTAAGAVVTPTGAVRDDLPTGTVTLLFTDLEGSTRMVERLGARFAEMLAEHLALLRASVHAYAGHEVGTEGDSLFAVFARAGDAVCAAAEAQRALAAHPWPPGVEVRVRMGLHTGAPDRRTGDYVGYDVHRAARIAAVAHGGQILVSEPTRALVEPLPAGLGAVDLGRHRLKDLSEPEHLFQLAVQGLRADFPPLRSQDVVPTNLPRERTSFVGREHDLDLLTGLLRRHRLVTLTGQGGSGKTRLAVRVARRALPDFPDGVWLVRLTEIQDPGLVGTAIATAVGLADAPGRDPVTAVAEFTRGQRHLLVVDNFEHVSPAAGTVADLLDRAPGVTLLVTSREVLHVSGEHAYAVVPLALPAPGASGVDLTVPEVTEVDSVRLFLERARDVRPDLTVTDVEVPYLAEIARRLEGLPLAIELAAAKVAVLSLRELADRLDDRLGILTGGARDLPARQRTLRATIAWSYELLTPEEQVMLRRLSVFVAPVDLATVETVCEGPDEPVLDAVAALVDKSLVRRTTASDGRSRFWMLESVKEFVREVAGDLAAERDAHARHYEQLARDLGEGLFGPGQLDWLDRAEEAAADVATAVGWCLGSGEIDRAGRIVVGMHGFWWLRAHFGTGRHWARRTLAAGVGDPVLRARLLLVGARLGAEQAAFEAAEADLLEAERIAREQGEVSLLAQTLSERIALDVRRGGEGRPELAEEALAGFRSRGDRVGEAEVLVRLGGVSAGLHRREEAVRLFESALGLFRAAGTPWGEASALNNLGFVAAEEGRLDEAEGLLHRSLALFEMLATPEGLGSVLDSLAAVRMAQGRVAEAVPLLERSLTIARELGYHPGIVVALTQLAWCRARLDDLATGAGEALEALELARSQPGGLRLAAVETAAAVLARSGRVDVAADLVTVTAQARTTHGARLTPLEAGRLAVDLALLSERGAGGPGTARGPGAEDQALTGDDAVEEAVDLAGRELRRAHPAW